MTNTQFQFKKVFYSFRWQRKTGAFREMINKSVDSAEIYGTHKKFHIVYPNSKMNLLINRIPKKYKSVIRVFLVNCKKIEGKLSKFLKCWKP